MGLITFLASLLIFQYITSMTEINIGYGGTIGGYSHRLTYAFGKESPEGYQDAGDDGPTYFIPQPNNVTFRRGQTATIQCSIENLGSKYVIWRKASDPHPISIGKLIYAPDKRFNVSFSNEHRKYDLIIRNVQPPDAGVYECQVSSVNKIIRHVMLKVTESSKPTTYVMPEIVLQGKEFVNSGETIRLICNISGASDGPQDLDWFKDGMLLRDSGKVLIHKQSSIAKRTLYSVLEVRHSKLEDSGTYVCRSSDILIDSQKIIVLNDEGRKLFEHEMLMPNITVGNINASEEKSNPGKRGTAGDATNGQMCNRQWWTLFATTMLIIFINKFLFYLT